MALAVATAAISGTLLPVSAAPAASIESKMCNFMLPLQMGGILTLSAAVKQPIDNQQDHADAEG